MPAEAAARSSRVREWLLLAALCAAVLLAYQPAWNGGLLWDDAAHLTRADLLSWRGLWRIWLEPGATQQYYPLLHSAFWVQHRLFGDSTTGYHLVSLALHCGAAVMVALALRRLEVPGAYLAAAIFALHPVQVESVAWITEQKNTLSAVFYLGAVLCWLRFEERRDARSYGLSLLLFLLALASKSVTATLPAALLLLHWWRRGKPSWRRDVVPLLPFFALGIASGIFTAWVERHLVGAEGAAFDRLTLVDRSLIAGRAAWFYLGKLVWPADLVFIYPRWSVSPGAWWQWLYPAAALLALGVLWALRRRMPGALAGTLFFLGTLFPALGFFDVYPFLFSFVADHFQYLASLGMIALAAAGAAWLLARAPRLRLAGSAACLAAVAALAVLTWRQSHLYADRETLYRATLRGNPECWMASNNLSGVLLKRGDADGALPLAERALELRPRYPEAHNNAGLALAALGRVDEAVRHYRAALEIDPDYAEACNNLGFALAALGQIDEAMAQYRHALEIDEANAGIHYNLAMAQIQSGQEQAAIFHLRRAVALRPDWLQAHNNLGILLARQGRLQEAIVEFRQALEIAPGSAEVRRNLEIAVGRASLAR